MGGPLHGCCTRETIRTLYWSVCDVHIMIHRSIILTNTLFRFSKQKRVSNSMREPKLQCLVLKWESNPRNLKNKKYYIRANKRLRCGMWVEKNSRLRSGYECCCCCCCCCCVCVLCALRQSYEGCQSTPPRRVVQCVRGACCAVCVCRPRAQRTTTFSLTAHVCSKKKSKERPRQHAALVDKAPDGVIDVASAPCQPSPA